METGRTGRVQVEDIVFLVRKDSRKYARVKDLLTMNEELKKVSCHTIQLGFTILIYILFIPTGSQSIRRGQVRRCFMKR